MKLPVVGFFVFLVFLLLATRSFAGGEVFMVAGAEACPKGYETIYAGSIIAVRSKNDYAMAIPAGMCFENFSSTISNAFPSHPGDRWDSTDLRFARIGPCAMCRRAHPAH